ncbi:MAG: hypothetical protein IE933_02545 [Sphingomonadales bacterium]|nr:hypothetical protein [Sphingomonadales bacterium]MBD3774601.1 hypothetical protein [Paracoccaceae bacterium]
MTRALTATLFLLAGACSGGGEAQPQADAGAVTIDCAIGPGGTFGPDCKVEQVQEGDAQLLVVRHPDGSFRRFVLLADGRGLAVADGADEAALDYRNGMLEVTVAGDRYRFPATDKSAQGKAETGSGDAPGE